MQGARERLGDNHHHLVCRGCGHTEDVDCVVGGAPCLQPSESRGFVLDEAEVVFWGLCPSCTSITDRRSNRGTKEHG